VPSQTPIFVGRLRELSALQSALDAAQNGKGRVVLIVGEPGIGKTCIANEIAGRARESGAEVLAGRCYEGPGAPAFWPWTQVVRAYASGRDGATLAAELGLGAVDVASVIPELHQWLPGLGAPPQVDEAQARFRFFDALSRTLVSAARQRPVVIVLEDLHAADPSSLLLLQFLGREVGGSGIVVVGTLRTLQLLPGQPLANTLGELVRERVSERLELTGLDADEVTELMTRIAGEVPTAALAREVHSRTEGNPLYVVEVVRGLVELGGFVAAHAGLTVPPSVRAAIARHLGMLSPAAYDTVALAALFGREFRPQVVARAGGGPVEVVLTHLDEAVAARIVTSPGERRKYRFAHSLFAETLVEGFGEARRVALHCQAASALAADANVDGLVPEIAHHWFAAGPSGEPAEAIEWARRAAERAAAVLAHENAAEWYERAQEALAWSEHQDPLLRAELLLGLGYARKRSGAGVEAKAAFEKAAAIGRAAHSPELLTRAALGYAPVVNWGDQPAPDPPLVALFEEAITAWQGRDSHLHAQALARLGIALIFGDRERRATLLVEAVAMARRVNDAATMRYTLTVLLSGYNQRSDVDGRLALATELVRLADPARDLEALATGRLWRAVHLAEVGDVVGADTEIAVLAHLADELQQPVWHWYVHNVRAMRATLEGRFTAAEESIEVAYRIGREMLPYAAEAYHVGQRFHVQTLRGRFECAAEYRAAFEMHPDPAALSPVAWVEYERGRPEEARAILDRLAADNFAAIRSETFDTSAMFLAEACAMLEDRDRAPTLYELLAPRAGRWPVWCETMPLGPVAHMLGLLARTMGRFDVAVEHFELAIADARRIGARPFLARTLYEHAVLLRRRDHPGDAERSATLLAEANAIAEAIGMEGLHRKIAACDPGAMGPAVRPELARTVFRREADYWIVSYAGTTVRMRDARGMRYLATLLHHPAREFHATTLVSGNVATGAPANGVSADDNIAIRQGLDAGDSQKLDARAQAAYRARLLELDDELELAERLHDLGRGARARAERDMLRTELLEAARGRRSATHGERARLSVTKGIGSAIARIDAEHPTLGAHLRATVRRGYFCVYTPDPRNPITWEC
jgi:tetratricopeptide (TPR) repeat protein